MNRVMKQPAGLFDEEWVRSILQSAAADSVRDALESGKEPDAVSEVVKAAIQSTIPELAALISEGAQRHAKKGLRHNRRLRAGFENRLRKRWAKAFDMYELVLGSATELGEGFWIHHGPAVAETPNAIKLVAMTGLHARACRTAAEVLALLSTGFPVGARARWRTIHELAVVSSLLGEHDPGLSQRYMDYSTIERAKDAEEFQVHAQHLGYEPLASEELEQFRQARAALIQKYGKEFNSDNGWAAMLTKSGKAPTMRTLESMAGLDHLRPYYRFGSHGIHAGSRASELTVLQRGTGAVLMAGAVNSGLAEPAHGSLISLLQVTTSLVVRGRHGHIGYNEVILAAALQPMVDAAGCVFAAIEAELDEEEQRLWSPAAVSTRATDAQGNP
jgi:hypothetical protein